MKLILRALLNIWLMALVITVPKLENWKRLCLKRRKWQSVTETICSHNFKQIAALNSCDRIKSLELCPHNWNDLQNELFRRFFLRVSMMNVRAGSYHEKYTPFKLAVDTMERSSSKSIAWHGFESVRIQTCGRFFSLYRYALASACLRNQFWSTGSKRMLIFAWIIHEEFKWKENFVRIYAPLYALDVALN